MVKKIINKDTWLTNTLGFNAYNATGNLLLLNKNKILPYRFIDAKTDLTAFDEIENLQKIGFRLIDTNVQFKTSYISLSKSYNGCRFAVPSDKEVIKKIAAESFIFSRFHLDKRISIDKANKIKSEWAGNFFKGNRGEWMIVFENKEKILGFLLLLKKPENTIVIDLIGVKKESQGKGIGKAMISFAFSNCISDQKSLVIAGTQLSNYKSLKFYSKLGFIISSANYVFHYHNK